MTVKCPKCASDISDTYEPTDYETGIIAGCYCDACNLGIGEHEVKREPMEGDVEIPPAPTRSDGKLSTSRLGISRDLCHTGMFTIEQCREAWRALRNVQYPAIREWYKSRKEAA